jgi:pimeloyl-ACP methyl ester carboxylesterase
LRRIPLSHRSHIIGFQPLPTGVVHLNIRKGMLHDGAGSSLGSYARRRLRSSCSTQGHRMQGQDRLINIGDRSLFARVHGSGPVVVLSSGRGTAGVGAWDPIETPVALFATVLSYDRAGLGRSDPSPVAPTAANMVSDLHALLTALSVSTPVVLVGRSLGALPVQLYACEYPSNVAGIVLLDPTPDQLLTGFHARTSGGYAARREPEKSGEASHLERERMPESCAQVRRAIEEQKRMPNIPVVVITAAIRAEMGPASNVVADSLVLAHQHMAQRVPHGRLVVAERSSHTTMLSDQPELIVETIKSVLERQQRKP